jgi:hypothetical protein
LVDWLNSAPGKRALRIEKLLEAAARRRGASERVTPQMFERLLQRFPERTIPAGAIRRPKKPAHGFTALRVARSRPDLEIKTDYPDRAKEGLGPAFKGATWIINRILRDYKLSPRLFASVNDRWTVDWYGGKRLTPDEARAVFRFLQLSSEGLLSRVKRCANQKCGRWFYARFVHQQYDSARCKDQVLQSDPGWKERRRQYMRRLRQIHKERGG